jgi:hypothetical protein
VKEIATLKSTTASRLFEDIDSTSV